MSNEKILLVEDDIDLGKIVKRYLQSESFDVYIAEDGEEAINLFKTINPQLVILDIMIPKVDGMEVCRLIRSESKVPIMMLSAKNTDLDKVLSLGLGADDYLVKPFSPMELVARVKAQLRRYISFNGDKDDKKQELIKSKDIEIDELAHTISVKGEVLNLTSKEFDILRFLCKNPNHVFSKEQIYEEVWGFNEYGEVNAVVVYIKRLREKLGQVDADYIKTIWGVGYKLETK